MSGADLRLALVGLGAGVLNGLIAIGGGIVMVPALVHQRGASAQVAVGTSLAAMTVMALLALCAHLLAGGLNQPWGALLGVVAGGLAGIGLGSWLLAQISTRRMLLMFSLLVFALAARLFAQGLGLDAGADAAVTPPAWAYPAVGVVAGLCSGLFGVGGGGLVLLALAVFYAMPLDVGLPLAIAVNFSNALLGGLGHARAGRVLWPDVRRLVLCSLVGIAAGTLLAVRLPADALRLAFATFFLFNGALLMRRALAMQR